jgi:flagellar basal-body rod modification protein FlgD
VTNPVSGVGSTGATSTTATGTTKTAGDEFGKDTFLKLLVAQLKYQNPLQPADGQQYMAQMAQFTTVEKLADIQKSQSDAVTWQRAVAGQGMIGQQITATVAATGTKVSGLVTGMSFSDSGARLTLSDGTTVSVEEVTAVKAASPAAPAPAPAAVPTPTPAATPAPTTTTTTPTTPSGTTSPTSTTSPTTGTASSTPGTTTTPTSPSAGTTGTPASS